MSRCHADLHCFNMYVWILYGPHNGNKHSDSGLKKKKKKKLKKHKLLHLAQKQNEWNAATKNQFWHISWVCNKNVKKKYDQLKSKSKLIASVSFPDWKQEFGHSVSEDSMSKRHSYWNMMNTSHIDWYELSPTYECKVGYLRQQSVATLWLVSYYLM